MSKNEKHHFVQKSYIKQWDTLPDNKLNVYLIEEKKIDRKGANEKAFWRKNFNIIDGDRVAEDVASLIDSEAIKIIKKLNYSGVKLTAYDRSVLAQYVVLQYVRTPRFRAEQDALIDATIKKLHQKDMDSFRNMKVSKEEIIEEVKGHKDEAKILLELEHKTEKEIKDDMLKVFESGEYSITLNNSGHSKQILKIADKAEVLHYSEWKFLIAPEGTSFITSDAPCYTISERKDMTGIISPFVDVYFPLSPKICLSINPGIKLQTEKTKSVDKKRVREINEMTLKNSYNLIIALDKDQLEKLTKKYSSEAHIKSRGATITEFGEYLKISIE